MVQASLIGRLVCTLGPCRRCGLSARMYEALLASLAIVVWHFYFTMLNPDVFPISKAMITGRLTKEEMEHAHAAELCERDCAAESSPRQRPTDAGG